MLQKLMQETSERFSRGAKKKAIKGARCAAAAGVAARVTPAAGSFGALLSLEEKQRAATSAKGAKAGQAHHGP